MSKAFSREAELSAGGCRVFSLCVQRIKVETSVSRLCRMEATALACDADFTSWQSSGLSGLCRKSKEGPQSGHKFPRLKREGSVGYGRGAGKETGAESGGPHENLKRG